MTDQLHTYIALLRGINVSGQKKIRMAELREILSASPHLHKLQTYIQSGNLVFCSELEAGPCANLLSDLILKAYGYRVSVLVRSVSSWKQVVGGNPFLYSDPEMEIGKLYVTFLDAIPTEAHLENLRERDFGEDHWQQLEDVIYVAYHSKYSDSKLDNNMLERILKVTCTTRNWRTTKKLLAMVEG